MAQWIKASGEIETVTPKNGRDFQLEELREFVGGYIELVPVGSALMVVNEDGNMLQLPFNENASYLAGQRIVGNVLVCRNNEIR